MESVRRFNQAIRYIRDITKKDDFSLRQIEFFLELVISHPDPLTVSELRKRTGSSRSVISRNYSFNAFGSKLVRKKDGSVVQEGLGWVDAQRSPFGGKEFEISLTPEGVEVAKKITVVIEGGKAWHS